MVRLPPLSILTVISDGVLELTTPVTVAPSRVTTVACGAFASGDACPVSRWVQLARSTADTSAIKTETFIDASIRPEFVDDPSLQQKPRGHRRHRRCK